MAISSIHGLPAAILTLLWLGGLSACTPLKQGQQGYVFWDCRDVPCEESGKTLIPHGKFAEVRQQARKLIQGMLDEEMVAGLSIALVDSKGPLWIEGFGQADSRSGAAAAADTVYRIGSLSKPLTALGVMQLAARGKIDLDSPLVMQLSGFSIRYHQTQRMAITPRQLLSHRSGLPSDLRKGMYTATPFMRVTELLKNEYAAYPPNTVYDYSNLGYDLLGALIQESSGESFRHYQQSQLFEPLGMHNTAYVLSSALEQHLAAGHENGQVRPQPPLRDTPALGLYSTAVDLGRLLTALLQNRIPGLHKGSLVEMWTPQTVKGEIAFGFSPGLGWFIEDDKGLGRVVRHGGATLLFGSEMALLPGQGLGVVVLTNSAGGNRVARQLAATILHLALQERGSRIQVRAISTPRIHERSQLVPSGGYATDLGLLMIDPERPRLCACIIEQMLDMVRFDDGSYGLTPESAAELPSGYKILGEMRFRSRRMGGRDLLLADRSGEEMVLGSRIEGGRWDRVWRQRIGSYRTINPDSAYSIEDLSISNEKGVLCLHYRAPHLSDQTIRVPIKPVSATEAVIEGLGRGRGETVSIVEVNGKQCLRFSGYLGEPMGPSR